MKHNLENFILTVLVLLLIGICGGMAARCFDVPNCGELDGPKQSIELNR